MSDVPLSTSRRVKICFFQHIISPKKPILHKKKKVLELVRFFNQSNSLFYCKNLGNSTGFETFPNVKILTLLKEKTKVTDFSIHYFQSRRGRSSTRSPRISVCTAEDVNTEHPVEVQEGEAWDRLHTIQDALL